MSTGIKRPYSQALSVAVRVMDGLASSCTWIELAGSLRRKRDMIGDIEIVAAPDGNKLYEVLDKKLADGIISHLPKRRWGQKQRSFMFNDFQFDVFIQPDPATIGINFMIRTGSAEFSHKMVTERSKGGFMPDGYKIRDARVWKGDTALPTPDELGVFLLWGMDFVEPDKRTAEYKPVFNAQRAEANVLVAMEAKPRSACLEPGWAERVLKMSEDW